MKKILFSAMVLAAAVGCNKTQVVGEDTTQGVAIQVSSSMEGVTASKASYAGDVAITGLQFLRLDNAGGALPTSFAGVLPFSGNRAVGGVITFGSTQNYDETLNTYIASYFPSGALAANTITWNIDGKTDVLLAGAIDAGTKATPLTVTPLAYKHQLAQIEVICKSAESGATVQTRWGNIVSIKVVDTPVSLALNLNDMKVSNGAQLGKLALTKPGYSDDFESIAIQANTASAVTAVAMMAPMNSRTFSLEVVTALGGTKTVTIDLGENKQIARAMKHVITLTFHKATVGAKAIEVTAADIEAWGVGAAGAGDVK